jgi:hypothetical protein
MICPWGAVSSDSTSRDASSMGKFQNIRHSSPQWLAFSSHEITILKIFRKYTLLENWDVLLKE